MESLSLASSSSGSSSSMNASTLVEVPISITPVIKSTRGSKIPLYVDISFGKEVASLDFACLRFDNYYVSSVGLMAQVGNVSGGYFTVLENKVLMPKADCEYGAQCGFSIRVEELNLNKIVNDNSSSAGSTCGLLRGLKSFRLYVYQPSPQWDAFELRNIKAFAQRANSAATATISGQAAATSVQLQSIRSMVACDLDLLLELRRQQSEQTSSSSSLRGSDRDLERYRRDIGKKKDKKRRK
jgi:hypothetical protein